MPVQIKQVVLEIRGKPRQQINVESGVLTVQGNISIQIVKGVMTIRLPEQK